MASFVRCEICSVRPFLKSLLSHHGSLTSPLRIIGEASDFRTVMQAQGPWRRRWLRLEQSRWTYGRDLASRGTAVNCSGPTLNVNVIGSKDEKCGLSIENFLADAEEQASFDSSRCTYFPALCSMRSPIWGLESNHPLIRITTTVQTSYLSGIFCRVRTV